MNKLFYFLSFTLLSLWLFSGCKTDPPPTKLQSGMVDGVVRDATTFNSVPYATAFLLKGESTGSIWGCCPTTIIDQTVADSEGVFFFNLEFEPGFFYACGAVADFYMEEDLQYNVDYFVTEGNNVEVLLNPKGFLSIHLKAEYANDPSDYITVTDLYENFYGAVDTTVTLTVYGNKETHLVWWVYDDGINDGSENADIFCPAFDTTYFEIIY
jgi:hypothetical protein